MTDKKQAEVEPVAEPVVVPDAVAKLIQARQNDIQSLMDQRTELVDMAASLCNVNGDHVLTQMPDGQLAFVLKPESTQQ